VPLLERLAPYFFFVIFVIGPVHLIWGQSGNDVPNFVKWWCAVIGVTDSQQIQTAIGVFAAGALLAAIFYSWRFLLIVLYWMNAR
jgi:hypothetical protein